MTRHQEQRISVASKRLAHRLRIVLIDLTAHRNQFCGFHESFAALYITRFWMYLPNKYYTQFLPELQMR